MTGRRFVSIWFRYLKTDQLQRRRPALQQKPIVLAILDHGRKRISAANRLTERQGIHAGMTVADARAIIPELEVLDDTPGVETQLLASIAEWAIRFTPCTAIDAPDGLLLDVTGCSHLWGGDTPYLQAIHTRLTTAGYDIRIAMADTIGAAWAIARYGTVPAVGGKGTATVVEVKGTATVVGGNGALTVVEGKTQTDVLLGLPPAALRLEAQTLERLQKLGLLTIGHFAHLPRTALRRRFGPSLLLRLDQAFGRESEGLQPLHPTPEYHERLPCLEPIATATGIGIALHRLLQTLTTRLQKEGKGLREAVLKAWRVDGKAEQIAIATNRPSHNAVHLFKLFELKIQTIEPDLGIELFVLEAPIVEELSPEQEQLWAGDHGLEDRKVAELIDRITGRLGAASIRRYLPDEHHWPERSIRLSANLGEKAAIPWRTDRPRPTRLLPKPEPIEVAAPVPDYPPMLFRYRGRVYPIKKADGPERIEREWWIEEGPHRDYYVVEDEAGARYWLFRSGHYSGDNTQQWFLHGYFS